MKIAILGSGNIGGILGRRLSATHPITFGVRDPGAPEVSALVTACGPNARAAASADAVKGGDVVILAVPGGAAESMVAALAPALNGRILIDATNPVGPGFTLTAGGAAPSTAERLAAVAPGALVVKAFNSAGFNIWADPSFSEGPADLYLCGDDAAARNTVAALARELGLEPVDCGPLASARLLEPLALLWITLAMKQGLGRDIAFKLLRRKESH